MKIKGKAVIQVIDSRTSEIKQVVEQDNIIPNAALLSILGWMANPVFGNARISVSQNVVVPTLTNNTVAGIVGTGYVPAGVTSPIVDTNSDPPFGKIQNRIDYVNVERTIRSIALTTLASNSNQNQLTTTALAYLLLDVPCVQGATDFLDITYYVFVDNVEGEGVMEISLKSFTLALFNVSSYINQTMFLMGPLYSSPFNLPNVTIYNYKNFNPGNLLTNFPGNVGQNWTSGTLVANLFKWKAIADWGVNSIVGTIINSFYQGTNLSANAIFAAKPLIRNQLPPIQNQFKKASSATFPFFDSLEIATGSGSVLFNVSAAGWTGKYPHLYRINIINGGATGTATYKIQRRKLLGFNGNTYTDTSIPNPFCNRLLPAADNFHGWRIGDDLLWYGPTQIVQYDDTGVTLLDLTDGSFKCWDANTTPALPVTQARQCAVDPINKLIYVGCRNSGIWVINVTANTVVNPVTLKCYGIDVGKDNIAFALVEGALISSANWGLTLNFNYIGISNNNWSQVYWLKADPEDSRKCLAIAMLNSSGINQVIWWDAANANAIAGPADNFLIKSWPSSFDVSDTGSFWSGYNSINNNLKGLYVLTYGSFSTNRLIVEGQAIFPPRRSNSHPIWGVTEFYKISFISANFIADRVLVSKFGTAITSYNEFQFGPAIHLDGGITLAGNSMRQLFTDNIYCWEKYGWNGTNWELNHVGAKNTHSAIEDLIDGLQIRFVDGAAAPHFVANEFYNQFVNWGLLKDNATTLYYNSGWYTKTAKFDVLVPAGFTIPSSAPYTLQLPVAQESGFISIEIDNPDLNSFAIAGIPIATLYTTGSVPPGPNEIRLAANGTMTFNAADAGKVVTGTFAYVKD